jgi:acetolactate synthase-1/2/3 large subunit
MNIAQRIIHIWQKIGVKYAFGVPGEETLDIIDALKNSDIELIITRHEQGAGFMAATYGRLTGIPAICLTTLGPGATNALTAMAYAKLGQMPMILVSGQKPVREVKQGCFQMVDILAMAEPVSNFSQRFTKAAAAPSLAMQAYHTATTSRGPVHLELPEDIGVEKVSDKAADIKYPKAYSTYASDTALNETASRIEKATTPLLIVGQRANELSASKALSKLIERTHIPFVTTQMGKGAVDETSPEYVGTTAFSSDDFVHKVIADSDLLIMVGHNHAEKPPFMACCNSQEILHIDDQPAFFNEVYMPSCEVIGDITHSIDSLTNSITPDDNWDFGGLKKNYGAFKTHEKELNSSEGNTPFQIVRQVKDAMPDDGIVMLDNGMYKIWFARHYRATLPNTLLLDNALATMGAGLPSAIAASLMHPEKSVLAICGDGGFMMNSQELETAVRLKLNLVLLILKDNAFGMIRWKQEADGFDNYAMEFGNPDFVTLAESYGATGHRVDKVSELTETIMSAHQSKDVHVIELPIDYQENDILNRLQEISG